MTGLDPTPESRHADPVRLGEEGRPFPLDEASPDISPVLSRRQLMIMAASLFCVGLSGRRSEAGDLQPQVIGAPSTYVTRYEDTLMDVARAADVGFVEIRAANPIIDPWLPGAGTRIVLPTQHVVPDAPRRGIVINVAELRLYYFPPDRRPVLTFPVGIGDEGKETPLGRTLIVRKARHPIWIPTRLEREENPELPAVVPAGPDNPMGDYALYLGWSGYAIHGTNNPDSIGRRDSHGCLRLYPEDIHALFERVPVGTAVTVVNQPVKLGWLDGELYLQVHPGQDAADAVESWGAVPQEAADVDDLIVKTAGSDIGRIDWYAAHLAALQRRGIPVRITRPAIPSS
jgi:L,D-transpeptidase ErfK/SrfK